MRPGAHSIPYYHNTLGDPLWPPKTAGCAESSTEEDSTTSHDRGSTPKRAKTCFWLHEYTGVLCVVGGFVRASYHYGRFSDRRLKWWGVIRVFRAVRRKCAQIKGGGTPVRMVPEPLRYDQSSNYAPCQTGIIRYSEPRLANPACSYY